MASAPYTHASYRSRQSLRSRALSFVLAIAVAVGLIVALLNLGVFTERRVRDNPLATFQVLPPAAEDSKGSPKIAKARPVKQRSPPPPRSVTPPPEVPPLPPNYLELTRRDFAASDIGKIKGKPSEDTGTGDAPDTESASTYGPGDGPGGQRLYSAEWVREPTRAELAFYLPAERREGWGVIACQTIERNRVDNCRVVAESPGSGIARGLREAAWQFLVRPPRIGGKPVVGAWVRIRFDLIKGVQK